LMCTPCVLALPRPALQAADLGFCRWKSAQSEGSIPSSSTHALTQLTRAHRLGGRAAGPRSGLGRRARRLRPC
jgi:hypothetical protein